MSLTDPETLPDRGHNLPPGIDMLPSLPPEPSAEAVAEAIANEPEREEPPPFDAEAVASFKLRVSAFADACGKWRDLKTITSAEQSEKLTDFITGARGVKKQIEEKRKSDKKVWDDKGKAVMAAYTDLTDVMDRAVDSVKPLQADWLRRENERIAAEKAEAARIAAEKQAEAERLAAQAAARNDVAGEAEAAKLLKEAGKQAKAAARPVKASAGSATGAGRTMSIRKTKVAVIHSQNGVYMHFRSHPAVVDLLQRLANEAVRAGEVFEERLLTVKEVESVA